MRALVTSPAQSWSCPKPHRRPRLYRVKLASGHHGARVAVERTGSHSSRVTLGWRAVSARRELREIDERETSEGVPGHRECGGKSYLNR